MLCNPIPPIGRRHAGVWPSRAALSAAALAIALALFARIGTASADAPVDFNRDVRPILSDNCFACHGFDPSTRKAKLRLDTAEGATAERNGERPIVAGDPAKSEVWARIV